MLDMGGMPGGGSSSSSKKVKPINASKNNQLQVVAFDFDLLTRATTTTTSPSNNNENISNNTANATKQQSSSSSSILPNVNMIQDVAKLLNVSLGGEEEEEDGRKRRRRRDDDEDDLSALIGNTTGSTDRSSRSSIDDDDDDDETVKVKAATTKTSSSSATATASSSSSILGGSSDIRNKYAEKLRNRIDGGSVSTMERVKEETTRGGDADGHLAARNIAIQQGNSSKSSKWMALTGTGTLLQYLSNRSMKLCLLPQVPTASGSSTTTMVEGDNELQKQRMKEFETQLPSVQIDMLATFPKYDDDDDKSTSSTTNRQQQQQRLLTNLIKTIMKDLDVMDPKNAMIVSDRDEYLRVAKELGWVVCRHRANASTSRRGNVSEHYLIQSIPQVQDVVDEINGISFNALRQ